MKQGRLTRHIPGAKQRIAVFTFEDPDRTGLGDALAALTGRAILIESSFTSLGVLRYQGDLAPEAPGAPSYFDKVDQIVEAQNVSLAVWGRVRRSKESLLIDAYLQLPSDVVETYFAWSLQLPQEDGRPRPRRSPTTESDRGPAARAERSVDPGAAAGGRRHGCAAGAARDRGRAQRPAPSGPNLLAAGTARRLGPAPRRRAAPGMGSAAVLPGRMRRRVEHRRVRGSDAPVHRRRHRAADARVPHRGGSRGPRPDAGVQSDEPPLRRRALARDHRAVDIRAASRARARSRRRARAEPPSPTCTRSVASRSCWSRSTTPRPVAPAARGGSRDDAVWNRLAPDREAVRAIADELTEAALLYPGDPDLLHNLAVLFDYVGDPARAQKARTLAETLRQ